MMSLGSVWSRTGGRFLRGALLVGVRGYQFLLSPLLPASCRYYPSCSAYGYQAIHDHGAGKGLLLTGWRLLRCNPWTKGGLDPVPESGQWLPSIHPDGRERTATSKCVDSESARD